MDFKQQLIDGDPVAREPGLDAFHADTMRQRMLLESRNAPLERDGFSRALVAGAVAACLIAGIAVGLRMNETQPSAPARVAEPATRQLQFATPGGTRIIWTFHQEIDL